jgi:PKD repeat protein
MDSVKKNVNVGLSSATLSASGYNTLGSASVSGKTYTITSNVGSQVGAAWNKNRISLYNNFDFTFNVYQCGSADGMMFVMQNSGNQSIGTNTAGSDLGYYNSPSGIFDQSIGVELDIYKSASGYNDPDDSHLALVKNKNTTPIKPIYSTSSKMGASCANVKLRIVWNADTKVLTGYYSGTKIFSWTNDIVDSVFKGNPYVYFGFTGATGGLTATQSFSNDTLIYNKPQITIRGNATLCSGDSAILSASNGLQYLWTTSDTTKNITVKTAGKYSVIIMDSSGCIAYSDTLNIKVIPPVVANAGIDQYICLGGKAVIGATPVSGYSYSWISSPGGYSSSLAMDTVSPTVNTTYYLSVSDRSTGCHKSAIVKVFINPSPTAAFTVSSNCANKFLSFTNSSSSAANHKMSYLWKFDDGTLSTDSIPRKSFSKPGSHTIWLIAQTDSGCRDSMSKKVTVFAAPTIDFTVSNSCTGTAAAFTNNTTLPGGNVTAYHWNFGDGTTSTQAAPTKVYNAPGTYTVWLSATSDRGCTDSISKTVSVSPKAKASFGIFNTCASDSVEFVNASIIASGHSITAYSWDFGDGTTSALKDPHHKYAKAGTYSVKLTATADGGCDDTLKQDAVITAGPTVKIGGDINVCVGTTVQLYDSSTVPGPATITGRTWVFGDKSSTSSATNPTHNYTLPGTYWVWLISTTSTGCKDSSSTLVQVNKLPDTGFVATLIKGRQYNFSANDKSSVVYLWNFGDNNTATGATASHTYTSNGTYTVSLRIANIDSCVTSTTHSLAVNASALAEQMEQELGIQLYPNPATHQFTLAYTLARQSMVHIAILDITGRQIGVIANAQEAGGQYNWNVNTNDYNMQGGVYMIQMIVDGQAINKSLIQLK